MSVLTSPLRKSFLPQIPGSKPFLVSLLSFTVVLLASFAFVAHAQENSNRAGVTLVGDTSRPDISTFAQGENVELNFAAEGLKTINVPVTLELSIVDEHDQKIEARAIPVQPDANGHWQTRIAAPHSRLGFYLLI